jgi:hypothetical protein
LKSIEINNDKNALPLTGRFGVMAAVARRKCGAKLEVCLPQEVQSKHRNEAKIKNGWPPVKTVLPPVLKELLFK